MGASAALNGGPYSRWSSVADFAAFSVRAFELFQKHVTEHEADLQRPAHHLFRRIVYQAETTSLAIRNANNWALWLPAFALTRIRLEQVIVCSYLIHEDEQLGIQPYVSHIPVNEYRGLRTSLDDPDIARHLAASIDAATSLEAAARTQNELTPGFDVENDRFSRSWTQFDLRSMARRRDQLVESKNIRPGHRLEAEYVSIYKVASSMVHADGSSLSYKFLDVFVADGLKPMLMAVPTWAIIVAACTAHYDILQVGELLTVLGCEGHIAELQDLSQQWVRARDAHL